MCRALAQWRTLLKTHSMLSVNTCTRHASVLTKFPQPSRDIKLASQPNRTAYNPFDHHDEDHHHDEGPEDKLNRQQKRHEKRRKLQQSSHSTHSHYDDLEELSDNVVHHDVRIVGWSPEEIYSVIMNVGDYKEFIPYCIQSDVHTQTTTQRHDIMEAELLVGFQLYKISYMSKVDGSTTLDGKKLVSAVCENKKLFDHLNMEWKIGPGPREHTSSMDFLVSFRFTNKFYNGVASFFKSGVVDQMIPAFESRLRHVYGEPTSVTALSAAGRHQPAKRRRR